LKDIH